MISVFSSSPKRRQELEQPTNLRIRVLQEASANTSIIRAYSLPRRLRQRIPVGHIRVMA